MLSDKIVNGILELQGTSSTLGKEAILRKYANEPGFKETLKFAFDPTITTGIAKRKLDKGRHNLLDHSVTLEMFMNHFIVSNTGQDHDIGFAWNWINLHTDGQPRMIAMALAKKTLKIGAGLTTLNNVYGSDFIPILLPMLGIEYSKVKDKISGMHIATRKIDGQRRLITKVNGKVTMYTRKGLLDTGLIDIKQEMELYMPDNTVYDGELEAIGEFANNLELRQRSNSIANSKGPRSGLYFNIFDMMPYNEFIQDNVKYAALSRKKLLEILFGVVEHDTIQKLQTEDMRYIRHAEILMVSDNMEAFEGLFQQMIGRGEEGIMLIKANSQYRPGKRQNTWVKMKGKYEEDLLVKRVEWGKPDGKYNECMGNVVVDYKGYEVEVGSGFSDAQRMSFMADTDRIVGKLIAVEHQGESHDKLGGTSLSCPVFRGVRYDKSI